MIRVLLVLLCLAGPALAQAPVTVLAGEHQGFTRLSFLIGASSWNVGRTASGYGLRLPVQTGFAIEDVFAVITRKRIADLRAEDAALYIDLACSCHIRSFRFQDQWLVLDIRDGEPDPASPYEQILLANAAPLPVVMMQDQGSLPERLAYPPLPDMAALNYQAQLQADMVAAAAQGEVELVSPLAPDPAPLMQPVTRLEEQSRILPVALHHEVWSNGEELHAALSPTICPPDSAFDMASWAGTDFASATSQAYASLAEAQDETEAALQLARTFIAYGFGREAAQTLNDLHLHGDDTHLPLLAQIVDGKEAHSAFRAQEGCLGAVSLWRALASQSLQHVAPAEIAMVMETFRLLPTDLRLQLGERLKALFIARGDHSGARQIMAIAMGHHPNPLPTAPSAATYLDDITARLASGATVTEEDLRLVQSLGYEWRGMPEATSLTLVEVQIMSSLGAHRQALDRALTLPEGPRDAALITVVDALTEHALPEAFLAIAVTLPDALPAPAIHRVASRLIADGFADRALALLAPPTRSLDMAERRYLRAQAAVALGLAKVVEAELLGLTDPRAEALRAAVIATTPDTPLYAWRRADLSALHESEDDLLRQAARAVEADPLPSPPTPLAAREALISQAQDARALANALLSRFTTIP